MGKIKVNLYIDEDLWERFRRSCEQRDASASQTVRAFIRERLSSETGSARAGDRKEKGGEAKRR